MIFERAARREFAQSAAGISVALMAILVSTQLIRLLKSAAGGQVAPEAVAALLGFAAINYLPAVLSLTLFLSILLTLSRVYRDSEMVVWLSCGQPLTAWVNPVVRFALPIVLAIAALSGFLSPWANYSSADYRARLSGRNDVSQVSPGTFKEAADGKKVFFVEALTEDASQLGNVFVASMQDGKLGVVMAQTGHQATTANGDRFVVLESGRRYEIEPGSPEYKVMSFERYHVRTEDMERRSTDRSMHRLPFDELLLNDSLAAKGEIVWRIGVPVCALVLALLAIPLSYVNPRAGRSANMLIAVLVYAVYNNLLSISQTWVTLGKLPFWLGVWALHFVMLLPLVFLFYRRIALRMPWQRKRT